MGVKVGAETSDWRNWKNEIEMREDWEEQVWEEAGEGQSKGEVPTQFRTFN